MNILTLDELKDMKPDTVFAKGTITDPRLYRGEVKWVAIRGGIWDWAIYYHHSTYDFEYISRCGDKCFTEAVIKMLVPCSDEAFKMYRY